MSFFRLEDSHRLRGKYRESGLYGRGGISSRERPISGDGTLVSGLYRYKAVRVQIQWGPEGQLIPFARSVASQRGTVGFDSNLNATHRLSISKYAPSTWPSRILLYPAEEFCDYAIGGIPVPRPSV